MYVQTQTYKVKELSVIYTLPSIMRICKHVSDNNLKYQCLFMLFCKHFLAKLSSSFVNADRQVCLQEIFNMSIFLKESQSKWIQNSSEFFEKSK